MHLLILCASISAGPADEIDAARAAISRMPPQQQATTIIVSFLGSQDIDETRFALDVALNHVTLRRKIQRVQKVLGEPKETIWYIDYEELGWKLDGVKKLLARETYFRQVAIDSKEGYDTPMVRADWLIRNITFGQTYYELLFGNVKTLSDIFKVVGIDAKSPAVEIAQHGARVRESRVSCIGYRVVTFLGYSTFGPVWITDDIKDEEGKRPKEFINEKIDARRFQKPDAHEVIGVLPNGCYWYAITNDKDELQENVPDNIAIDQRDYRPHDQIKDISNERPNRARTVIANPHTCMTCHAIGMQPAPDWVADAISKRSLNITGYEKDDKRKLEDFFSSTRSRRLD
jgi:hypothetical protein